MRQRVKVLIDGLTRENPKIPSNILHAIRTVRPSQLMDTNLWDFKHLSVEQMGEELVENAELF